MESHSEGVATGRARNPEPGKRMALIALRGMKVFAWSDRETAYFSPTEDVYWYRWQTAEGAIDVWLGPRRVRLRQPR